MKLYLIALLGVLFVLSSCSKNDSQTTENVTSEVSQVAQEYPLITCVVSGEKLGSMGDPVIIEHNGTEVRFCCKKCIKKFKSDPATYLAKLKN